jgi:hypothetical protein
MKTAYRYELKANPGSPYVRNLTPTANSSRSSTSPPYSIGGGAGVSWTLDNYCLDLGLGGVTSDPNDNKIKKILPGQKLTGSIVWNPEAPITHMTYNWSVTGCDPFINYIHTVSPPLGQVVAYAAVTTPTTFAYFSKPGTGTISCTYKFKLNEAPQTEYTVNLSKNVPVVDLQNIESNIVAAAPGSIHILNPNGSHKLTFTTMNFNGRATTPSYFVQSGNYGSWDFVQLVTSSHITATINGTVEPYPGNFYTPRLDNTFPYAAGETANGNQGTTNDNPYLNFTAAAGLTKITLQYTFRMHWLYLPPGADSKYVSMRSRDWQWACEATAANNWNPTGTISVKGGGVTDHEISATVNWPKQPEWTQVAQNG